MRLSIMQLQAPLIYPVCLVHISRNFAGLSSLPFSLNTLTVLNGVVRCAWKPSRSVRENLARTTMCRAICSIITSKKPMVFGNLPPAAVKRASCKTHLNSSVCHSGGSRNPVISTCSGLRFLPEWRLLLLLQEAQELRIKNEECIMKFKIHNSTFSILH